MDKQPKGSVLEEGVQKFFECGWLLKIISGKYYLCNPRTSNLAYSKDDLIDDSCYTQFDYFTRFDYLTRDERDGALKILQFIENHPEVIQAYQKIYPKRIIYFD